MKNDLSNTEIAPATTLPESVRTPLHSLQADLGYLIGRVIADRSCGPMIIQSMRERLDQIESYFNAPAQGAPKPPYPIDPEGKKLAADWYTWGFQAGLEAERRGAARDAVKTSPAVTSTDDCPKGLDAKGAHAAAEFIADYADMNLTMWEACSEDDPAKARELFDAAMRLRDLLAPAVTSTVRGEEA